MKKAIVDFSQKSKHKYADSAVVVVLTHGGNDELYGTDRIPIDVYEDLLWKLDHENCIDLKNKPKLFVLLACRGGSITYVFVRLLN